MVAAAPAATAAVATERAGGRSAGVEGRHAAPRRVRSRAGVLLTTLATACGLWFGITAPDVSPVTPAGVPGVDQDGAP